VVFDSERNGARLPVCFQLDMRDTVIARAALLRLFPMPEDDRPHGRPADGDPPNMGRVQCPNCCRLAFVVSREMGLLHYRCELCLYVGASAPEADEPQG
jgi:hypothetical protein